MASLTRQEGIVSAEFTGTTPQNRCSLVVYERIDNALKFVAVLDEGVKFVLPKENVLPFFDKKRSYVSYAVNLEPPLPFPFKEIFQHKSIAHTFTLNFTLEYKVADRRKVVDRLSSDPLGRVIEDIKRIVGERVKVFEWADIIIQKKIDNCLTLIRTAAVNVEWKKLCDRAQTYGIELIDLPCTLDLSKKDEELYRVEAAAERESLLNTIKEKQKAKKELDDLTIKKSALEKDIVNLNNDLRINNELFESRILDIKRFNTAKDAFLNAIDTAIMRIANNVEDSSDLQRHIDTVIRTINNIAPTKYPQEESSTQTKALPSGQTLGSRESELVANLNEALETLGPLPKENPASRALIAATLHLLAEVYLTEEKDEKKVQSYITQIRNVCQKLEIKSDVRLFSFIKGLCSVTDLKNKFNA